MTRVSKKIVDDSVGKLCEEYLPRIENIIFILKSRREELVKDKKQLALLQSVSEGLYEEIDKLSKKAPAESLTDLAYSQVNDVIRESKLLIPEDPFIQRLNEFVAAGDYPEHRDAVIVLRQIRQGLERFETKVKPLSDQISKMLHEAAAIQEALQYFISQREQISIQEMTERGYVSHQYQSWIITNPYGVGNSFNYLRLEKIDLANYFQLGD